MYDFGLDSVTIDAFSCPLTSHEARNILHLMQDTYLLTYKPWKALLILAFPMILGNLFQQLYTMADTAIVGRFVSSAALAAVGASYSLTNIFICVAIGGGVGSSVIVARYFGAGEYGKMKRAIYTSLISFLAVSVMLGLLGLVMSREIMVLLNTPEDILNMATDYLGIYFLGLPFLFMYNVLSSMFNALGRSTIPLAFLVFSSALNVVLDLYCVIELGMGVKGAAWATLFSQGISALLSFIVLMRAIRKLSGERASIFSLAELRGMVRIAIPSILQQSTVSIGMMLVQSVVNSFGTEALAGYSAGMRIESICVVFMNGFGTAISSYAAQNLGAGMAERVRKGYRSSLVLVSITALLLLITVEAGKESLIRLFIGDGISETALSTGVDYLAFIACFFILIGFKMSTDGVLRGSGDMAAFTIANLVNLSIRVLVAMLLAPRIGIGAVWYAVPIGWAANWLISLAEYRTGRWQKAGKRNGT